MRSAAGQRSPAPNDENDVNRGSNRKLIAWSASGASSDTKNWWFESGKANSECRGSYGSKAAGVDFSNCWVSPTLAADLRMSHLMGAQSGSAGSKRHPATSELSSSRPCAYGPRNSQLSLSSSVRPHNLNELHKSRPLSQRSQSRC